MDLHTAFDVAMGLIGILIGWVLNSLRDSIRELRKDGSALTRQVQAIEVLVAGQYVKRDDMEKNMAAIFTKLDRIEAKLDGKQDK